MLKVNNIIIADEYLSFSYARSSGPGGQNVNKVNTLAQLRFKLTECDAITDAVKLRLKGVASRYVVGQGDLLIESQEYRSQLKNKEAALGKLREMILLALVVPKKRKATKPSRASKQRRLDAKKRRSDIKKQRGGPIDF